MRKKIKVFWAWLKGDRKRLIAAAVILIVVLIGGWRLLAGKAGKVQYQTSKVEKGTIVSTISASGKALTTSVLNINTQTSGVVKAVYVKDQDKVYAGQKLAEVTLDSSGQLAYYQALSSYLSAKNGLANANTSYYTLQAASFAANQKFINDAVARSLATDDPTYIQQYDAWKAAEANFLQNETSIKQANIALGNASISLSQVSPTITAPFAGEISNVELVEGMVIGGSSSSTTTSSQRVAVIKSQSSPHYQCHLKRD